MAVPIYTATFYNKPDALKLVRQYESHWRRIGKKGLTARVVKIGKSYEVRVYEKNQSNPSFGLPKNKWVNARVRVTSDGRIQATVSENVLGNLLGRGKKRRKR